jgi:ketosteroid isomerase-like protein
VATDGATIVRRGFDALDRLDLDALTAGWHDDVVWDVSGVSWWAGDRPAYEGEAAILDAFARFLSSIRVQRLDLHEITELRPGRVIALYTEIREHGETYDMGIVYDLDRGKVRRMRVFDDHERARRAAE